MGRCMCIYTKANCTKCALQHSRNEIKCTLLEIVKKLEAEEKAKLHSLKIQNLELQTTKWFIESCV